MVDVDDIDWISDGWFVFDIDNDPTTITINELVDEVDDPNDVDSWFVFDVDDPVLIDLVVDAITNCDAVFDVDDPVLVDADVDAIINCDAVFDVELTLLRFW